MVKVVVRLVNAPGEANKWLLDVLGHSYNRMEVLESWRSSRWQPEALTSTAVMNPPE